MTVLRNIVIATIGALVGVFALDLAMPVELTNGLAYFPVLFLATWHPKPWFSGAVLFACLVMMPAELLFISHWIAPAQLHVAMNNRGLAMAAIVASFALYSIGRFREVAFQHRLGGSEHRYRALVEMSPSAIILVARDGRIVFANAAALRLLGAAGSRQLVGRMFLEFVPREFHELAAMELGSAVGGTSPAGAVEMKMKRVRGTFVDVEIAGAPCDYDGEPASQTVIHDISRRRQAQVEIRQRLSELAHATRVSTMGALVSELAHEINQHLYAIANFGEACLNRLSAERREGARELTEWLEQIAIQARRAGEILRRVGQFIRKSPFNPTASQINDIVREMFQLLQVEVRAAELDLSLQLAENLPGVRVDRIQIEQVLVNLVHNAIEAMADNPPGDRRLVVRTEEAAPDSIRVSVRDAGSGVDPTISDRLFEPYLTTKSRGLGMGLSISRSIVEAHGGRLEAIANPDRGTTFQFTIPTAVLKEASAAPHEDARSDATV